MSNVKFDADGFFAALDAVRQTKRLTWKGVAEKSKISASTLTRIAQGKRPDVDTLAALCTWAELRSDDFLPSRSKSRPEPLSEITVCLRSDPNLTEQAADAIEALVKTAYDQLRTKG